MNFRRSHLIILLALCSTLGCYGNLPVITEAFDVLPFEIGVDGKIYVNAWVNTDTIPLRFLFDTGSIDNVLNTNSSQALNTIDRSALEEGQSNTNTSTTSVYITAYENSIILGETEFQGVRFVLAPCAEDIDGIIGWNTLTGVDFLVDYNQQQIRFFENGNCLIEDETL